MVSDVQDSNYALRVLITREANQSAFAALALDMDTWGFGQTREAACSDLSMNIRALISFAMQFDRIGLIEHAVPEAYLNRYYARRYSRLSSDLTNDRATSIAYPNIDFDPYRACPEHRLADHFCKLDDRFTFYIHEQNHTELILYSTDIEKCHAAYPLRFTGNSMTLAFPHIESIARRFDVEEQQLQFLTDDLPMPGEPAPGL